ncbi:MAG: glycosyltransferase family 2 protein [Bacteroidetes bacterium]|nr:glycosyltransferase family 2 protein [Bacteroidota bacterium]
MELSIIIVNYNVKDWLLKSVKSIYNYIQNIEFEIIVVDNNSTDDSISNIKTLYPNINIIENQYNAGFAEANNQGIRIAKGKFILMLNPDTELSDDSINKLISRASDLSKNDICAPCLLNSDNSIQHSTWKVPGVGSVLKEALFLNYVFAKNTNKINSEKSKIEVQCVSGAAMLFRKDLINKIGFLDKDLFWMDDTDFCYRVRKAGGGIFYFPSFKIYHHCGKSAAKNQKIVISNQILSKVKFFKKHFSFFIFLLSIIFSIIHIINRIIVFALLFPIPDFWRKEKAYCYSFIKFLKYIFAADKSIT